MSGKFMSIGLSLFAGSLFAAAPTAENVTMTQVEGTRRVEITYDLKNADAVVTLDIETNVTGNVWASIGGVAIGEPTGDVGVKVLKGDGKKIVWKPRLTWPDRVITGKGIRAVVTTWPVDRPADYATVDLTSGAIRFYTSTNTLPGGFADRAYKTQKLLLRRIPAKGKVWRMGSSPRVNACRTKEEECAHLVMLTDDFYLSVFEWTAWQHKKVGCSIESGTRNLADGENPDLCPPGPAYIGRFYGTGGPAYKVAQLTKVSAFCLPTETQWEFACRAGTSTELYNGKDIVTTGESDAVDAGLEDISWYSGNSGKKGHEVGKKEPNAFGLYDMLGNAAEACSDYASSGNNYLQSIANFTRGGVAIDPTGPAKNTISGDTYYVMRGSNCSNYYRIHRASSRSSVAAWSNGAHGVATCRICCPASEIAK